MLREGFSGERIEKEMVWNILLGQGLLAPEMQAPVTGLVIVDRQFHGVR
jgi:hypothetical protein